MMKSMPMKIRIYWSCVLGALILVACGPAAAGRPPAARDETAGVATADTLDRGGTFRANSPRADEPGSGRVALGTASPAARTVTPAPVREVRREPYPTEFVGFPCDPYKVDGLDALVWENTVRWQADGSAVFFSQGPKVYGVAADGAWARAVADASAWIDPRLPWHPRVRRDLAVGPMTYFDISPAGDRLVYATCGYLEDAVAESRRPSEELQGFLREGYDPRYTGTFVPNYELAVVGIAGGPAQRLTRSVRFDNFPVWSPDGTRLAFLAGASVRFAGLLIMRASGGNAPSIDTGEYILGLHPPQWSPDGSKLAVVGTDDSQHELAVLIVNADGGDLRRLGRTISGPSWSPDGRRLAFVGRAGDDDGAWDLLTMASDGTEVQRLALAADWAPSYAGGHAILTSLPKFSDGWIPTLAWSPAGDHLLYTCGLQDLRGGAGRHAGGPVADQVGVRERGGVVAGRRAHRGGHRHGLAALQRAGNAQRPRAVLDGPGRNGRSRAGGLRRRRRGASNGGAPAGAPATARERGRGAMPDGDGGGRPGGQPWVGGRLRGAIARAGPLGPALELEQRPTDQRLGRRGAAWVAVADT